MQRSSDPSNQTVPHATADDMDEPVGRDEPAAADSEPSRQRDLDASEQPAHEPSENELPTTQEKNPVPPDSTRP
jgi:hypothetical protein